MISLLNAVIKYLLGLREDLLHSQVHRALGHSHLIPHLWAQMRQYTVVQGYVAEVVYIMGNRKHTAIERYCGYYYLYLKNHHSDLDPQAR